MKISQMIRKGIFLVLILCALGCTNHALQFDRNELGEVFIPNSESLDLSDQAITTECGINAPDPAHGVISIIAAKGGAADSGSWKIRVTAEGIFQARYLINGQGSGLFTINLAVGAAVAGRGLC